MLFPRLCQSVNELLFFSSTGATPEKRVQKYTLSAKPQNLRRTFYAKTHSF